MKLAIIGRGKTGGQLLGLIQKDQVIGPYGRTPPTVQELKSADVAIVFVPAEGIHTIINLLLEARLPAVIGTTGMEIPLDLHKQLIKNERAWVWASNFSLGVHLMKFLAQKLASYQTIMPESSLSMIDIHHTHKKDAPSGTAKLINSWLPDPVAIESLRQGDEVGTHILSLKNELEELSLTHRAFDRKVFAQGALWAAQQLFELKQSKTKENGLLSFEKLIERKFNRGKDDEKI